ncbi:hypothetical protein M9H77_14910 [Catharanthus roseus]|uniref:Uncharacterized protein n=1 Tax=Catharanthus roseus TaxID=4058 RepID=A0ACC0BPN8_CATRO|nr:hypothetical protein M9H77_14910 [Catharanthus roseus]
MYSISDHRLVYERIVSPLASRTALFFYGFLAKVVVFCHLYLVLFKQCLKRDVFHICSMDQPRNHALGQKSSGEHVSEEFDSKPQGYTMDSSDYANTDINSLQHNGLEAKPVRNYSIQTGEEFALEFMRDRVNPKKHFVANISGDPSPAPVYMELKGMLGISHTGSESGSDISMLSIVEKGSKVFEQKNSSLYEDNSMYRSAQSFPRTSSDYSNSHSLAYTSSGVSDTSSTKLKALCSFGGKILPRPSDGKLRYVGGETRIIRIRKDIEWQELWQKTKAVYEQTHSIKYQLPGEDLDALVSVSSDEDLQNMMEECNVLDDGEGCKKLRLFLFSSSDLEDAHFSLANSDVDSEFQYVVAVNGMDIGRRKSSGLRGLGISSANNLDELEGTHCEMDASRAATEFLGVSTSTLAGFNVSLSSAETFQPILPNSYASELDSHFYHGQDVRYDESKLQSQQYNYNFPSSHFSPVEGVFQQHFNGDLGQEKRFDVQVLGGNNILGPNMQVKDGRLKLGNSIHQCASENSHLSANDCVSSSTPPNCNTKDSVPVEEKSVVVPKLGGEFPLKSSKKEGKPPESIRVPSSYETNTMDVPKLGADCYTTPSAFDPESIISESGPTGLNYPEPSVSSQRVFQSERIPREQVELLNRLSKSDDSHASQFLTTQSRSGITEQDLISETVERFQNGNMEIRKEQPFPSENPFSVDSQNIDTGYTKLQKMKQAVPDCYTNGDGSDNQGLFAEREIKCSKNNGENLLADDTDEAALSVTAANRLDLDKYHLPETLYGDTVGSKAVISTAEGHSQPSERTESLTNDVDHEKTSSFSRSEQPDILIDINDRFPRDFLSDIFSKAIISDSSSNIRPLQKDGTGLSLNIENHEPKHWSFFQKLAGNDFARKDVSLIDQDHIGYSAGLPKIEEASVAYGFEQLTKDGLSAGKVNPYRNFGENGQNDLPGAERIEAIVSHSDYSPSHLQISEGMQYDDLADNRRLPDSEYEDEQLKGLPLLDPSLVDFDINSLQLIYNEDLEELKELGSGTFGTVYHGKWRGTDVAIKRIKKSCFTGRSSEQERLSIEFWREADILSKLHHPNVVAFYGVVQDGPGGTLATVTEYMVDGSLRHVLLRKDRHLDRRKRLIIAMDAAFGMEYLHSKNIVHFDLKCDNLLVNLKDPSRPICKVGDFGLSKIKRNTLVSGGVRGTLPWMAPELLNGSSNKVSEKVDVFSFGIVLWEILTGEEPYANMHYGAIIGGIVNNTLRPLIPSFCDHEWRVLMEQCWAPNPVARPSFTEIAGRLRAMSAAASAQSKPAAAK